MNKLVTVLRNSRIRMFEYLVDEDTLVVYDDKFHIAKTVTEYMDYIDQKSRIHPEDREKVKKLYKEAFEEPVEIREIDDNGEIRRSVIELKKMVDESTGKLILIGTTRDIT